MRRAFQITERETPANAAGFGRTAWAITRVFDARLRRTAYGDAKNDLGEGAEMTDSETLDKARALFVGQTQGDTLAREVIAIAEQREHTIACEVEHSRKLEDQLKTMHGLLEPLRDAVLYARAQRRPMGIGQDHNQASPCVHLQLGAEYGRERDCVGFWINSAEIGHTDADSPNPCHRIALALIRLAYSVAEKVKPRT